MPQTSVVSDRVASQDAQTASHRCKCTRKPRLICELFLLPLYVSIFV